MPTLSEYIAYDALTPPNPFIAVTQDTRGNVVYDGGFPKFYNSAYTFGDAASFADLNASFKFLHNALNFVSNKTKVNAGNKNVLVLGDSTAQNYGVKSEIGSGFKIAFTKLFAVAGYVPTFMNSADYSNTLNPTPAELEGYCAVVLVSSDYTTKTGFLTQSAVAALVAFREAGNGLILITDHGEPVLDIEFAAHGSYQGFYRTVNQIAAEFGAYFKGNYDRTPVNVGFLRATYGDHPLYANMADTESIYAGLSESRVVVTQYPRYTAEQLPNIEMELGTYYVQILSALVDGTIEIQRQLYKMPSGVGAHTPVRKLYARATSTSPFIVNFSKGGWCVYTNGFALRMTPKNTRMWDAAMKQWIAVK